jgi:hypothetical protein
MLGGSWRGGADEFEVRFGEKARECGVVREVENAAIADALDVLDVLAGLLAGETVESLLTEAVVVSNGDRERGHGRSDGRSVWWCDGFGNRGLVVVAEDGRYRSERTVPARIVPDGVPVGSRLGVEPDESCPHPGEWNAFGSIGCASPFPR